MADQETREEGATESTETSSGATSETSSPESGTESDTGSTATESGSTESGATESGATESGSGETPARRSENHAKPQELSDSDREAQEANRRSFVEGGRTGGTEERAPVGEPRRRAIDVGELVWRVANVLATIIRVVTLVFADVLVAHIALVVVGVNPLNGVASFLAGFADVVVLGFRDLFQPVDPTIALVVNDGVAAVFWVVVGGFVSAGVRFLAARVS